MQRSLDWLIPPAVRPAAHDDYRRALVVSAGALLTAAFGLLISVMQAGWGIPTAAAASLTGAAVAVGLLLWVRRTGRWRAAAAMLSGAVWLPALVVSVASGGVMAAALYYLVLGAAMAALTIGPRAGLVLGAINAIVVGAIYASHLAGVTPPVAVLSDVARQSAMRGAFIFNLALAGLVAAYEMLRSAATRDSEANERRYRALADYGPDLIAELDAGGRVVDTSRGGDGFAHALAAPALDAIHPEDRESVRQALAQLERQPSVRVGPLRWTPAADSTRWIEASLTRYRAGRDDRTLVVARDVGERLALEAQLRQSHKMQAVGQLASGLSHDFNNLLMVISGYAEVLGHRGRGDPVATEAVAEVRTAVEQGAALTRRLLGLARPASQARRVLDANAVIGDCAKLLRVLLGEGISLSIDPAPVPLPIQADAGELEQVLVNLVANARDALGPNGAIRIGTARDADRVVITVADNGHGIDPAVQERIFEPFFTTKAPGGGTGLGLYVVYHVVAGLGGSVEVASDAGRGTTFRIELPLRAGEDPAVGARSAQAVGGGTERILLVEDRPEIRSLLRDALAAAGYEVLVAADGVEALALDVSDRVDLVLSDVVMPRMGGPAMVAALRQPRPELPALFMSGGPSGPGEIAPRDRVLRKPFLVDDLLLAVREVLGARGRG